MTNFLNSLRSRNKEWSTFSLLSDFQRVRLTWEREIPEADIYSFVRGSHVANIQNERVCVQYFTWCMSASDSKTYSWVNVVDFGICDDDASLRQVVKEYATQNLFKSDLEWKRDWLTIYIGATITSVPKYIFYSACEFFKLWG